MAVEQPGLCFGIRVARHLPAPRWRYCAAMSTRSEGFHGVRGRRVGIVVAVLISLALVWFGGYLVIRHVVETGCASPPTVSERAAQEVFVQARIPDASGLRWTVEDCDDFGQAYLSFQTKASVTEANEAFLSDPACSTLQDGSEDLVVCEVEGGSVTLVFYPSESNGDPTTGELYLPLPGEE